VGDLHYIHSDQDPRSDLDRAFAPPWQLDVYVLARLWRWLCFRELRPADPAYFFTHADEYAEHYRDMLMWTGAAE
jgi:hypothetical protein